MSYSAQAQLASDADFIARIASCAAEEVAKTHQPTQWARDHVWWLAAAPGFSEAYEYAINSDNPNPGKDPAVITDGMILGAVQALVAELEPPTP